MVWYVLATAAVLLLMVSPRFRVLALFVCLILSIIAGAYSLHCQYRETRSKKLIPVHDIEIRDAALKSTPFGNYKIIGRISNNSADYTLNRVSLRIVMEDCVEDESGDTDCEVIGDASEDLYVNAPPQHTREFEQYVYFFGNKPKTPDKLNWHYIVLHTHGEEYNLIGE